MARMTRTQISLEDEQYRFLKREAARRELSLSSVLRELIDVRMLEIAADSTSIMSMKGIFSDGRPTGQEHDLVLHEALAKRKTNQRVG